MSIADKAAVAFMAALLFGGRALAHPQMQSAQPAAGATTTSSPKQISIIFNEAFIPQFSGIELKARREK